LRSRSENREFVEATLNLLSISKYELNKRAQGMINKAFS
jgi:hypothetical protein